MNPKWRRVLTSRWPYWVVKLYLWRRRYGCEALRSLALAGADQVAAWYRQERPVVWTTAFVPTELIYALDLMPLAVEVAAALVTGLGLAPGLLAEAEKSWYSPDLCSYHRTVMGGALRDLWPRPVALVASSHLCDGAPRLFYNLGRLYGVPVRIIDVPARRSPAAESYVAAQLSELARWLERVTGASLSEAAIHRVFRLSNEARYWLEEANRWRRADPSPLPGQQALDFLWLGFMGQGSEAAARIYRQLAEELKARVTAAPAGAGDRYRLLWLHLRPYYRVDLWNFLAERGAVIAFEEFSHVYWPELAPEAPWSSLAKKMLSHFALGPVERRVEVIRHLAREYRCDGVIHYGHWGCRQSNGGARALQAALRNDGIPCLWLPGDCVDTRNYAAGQTLTRLAAFLEMLEARRSAVAVGGGSQ
ncbi:MAG: 2-hydroxyacyl-CoA dehydratase subunit D [Moorellales bacterium]